MMLTEAFIEGSIQDCHHPHKFSVSLVCRGVVSRGEPLGNVMLQEGFVKLLKCNGILG